VPVDGRGGLDDAGPGQIERAAGAGRAARLAPVGLAGERDVAAGEAAPPVQDGIAGGPGAVEGDRHGDDAASLLVG
jgi:hypothetical protein